MITSSTFETIPGQTLWMVEGLRMSTTARCWEKYSSVFTLMTCMLSSGQRMSLLMAMVSASGLIGWLRLTPGMIYLMKPVGALLRPSYLVTYGLGGKASHTPSSLCGVRS